MRLKDLNERFNQHGFEISLEEYFIHKDNLLAHGEIVLSDDELESTKKIDAMLIKLAECTNTDFSFEVVKNLKAEIKSLNGILKSKRESTDFGTYKNIINAYSEVLRLIDKYEWKQMCSVYKIPNANGSGEFVDMISIWEQNSEGQIRNCRVFERGIEYVDGLK